MKYRPSGNFTRLIAVMLIAALVCQLPAGTFVGKATALETENISENTPTSGYATPELSTNNVSLLSLTDIPAFLPLEQVQERNHILRLSDEEVANTLVYLNADGTKTMYIMDFPVKYTSSTGTSEFYDLTIREDKNAYTITSSDVGFSASKNVDQGFTMTYDDFSISLVAVPELTSNGSISASPIPTVSATNECVTYLNVFGSGTSLRYSPLYNGVKEDIILSEYTGLSSFSFLMNTGGKYVFEGEDGYYIANSAKDALRINIGNVVVYDSKIKISEGTLAITPIKDGFVYQVTITADKAFLESSETAYPVVIDPTLTISNSTHGDNAICDSPVYSGLPTQNFGNYTFNRAGYVNETYKIGRTAVRLNGLINSTVYPTLSADAVQNVKLYIRDSSGHPQRTINIYALENIPVWAEDSLTWNNTVGNISSELQATATLTSNAWSSFDITNLVKKWINGTYDAACGFIMQGEDETVDSNFYSSEAASSNWPYIEITYLSAGSGGGSSFTTAEVIGFGDIKTVHPVITNEKRYFKFTPTTSGEYLFYSVRESGDPMIWLYNSSYVLIDNNDDGGAESNFRLAATLTAGNTYYIALGHFSTRAGEYQLHILRDAGIASGTYYLKNVETTYYMDIHGPNAQEKVHQWEYHTGTQMKWTFTRDSNGYYTIQSLYGDKKYLSVSSADVGIDNIVLIPNVTDYAHWKIYKDVNNQLYLEPKYSKGRTLYVPNYLQGTELQLVITSTNNNNRNKWKISSASTTAPHTHEYHVLGPGMSSTHPHDLVMRCDCGATKTSYNVSLNCDICMADRDEVTNVVMVQLVVVNFDYDFESGAWAPGLFLVKCYVEYTNKFICPTSIIANFPTFATYSSSVNTYADVPDLCPNVDCLAHNEVEYYSSNGSVMLIQELQGFFSSTTNSYPPGMIYTLPAVPSYAVAGATFAAASSNAPSKNVSITTYFP